MTLLLLLNFAALGAICVLLLIVLRKTIAIHRATYSLLEDAGAARREAESLFSQVQSLLALERLLRLERALPPMRGWAGSPDFLLKVAEEVLARRPECVVECSSGVSTIVIARCLQLVGRGKVISLEHDTAYAAKTRHLLARYQLDEWATIVEAPLCSNEGELPWYDLSKLPASIAPIDVLVVDGPPASVGRLARHPALPRLAPLLAPRCLVMLDDAHRPDEQEVVALWSKQFPEFRAAHLPLEKGLALLERER